MSPTLSKPQTSIVRGLSPSFESCLRDHPVSIDIDRARDQHRAYIKLMEEMVDRVVELPSSSEHPDCCYVEDTVVCLNRYALITRPGAPSRRGECDAMRHEIASHFELVVMQAPATLDGGDVLRAGNTFFVGQSARTNEAGIASLTEVASRDGAKVVPVQVSKGLHLKSACTMLDEETVIIDPEVLNASCFTSHGLKTVEACEPLGANVLAFGDSVIASEAAPKTIERLQSLGYALRTLCVDELHKGDGALTCLSVRIQPANHWSV